MKEQNSNRVMLDFAVLCQEDLGPLCQNWFEELTLSACSSQFKQHGGEVHSATPGYNNDYFKTPWQKQILHSQLDCTPSIFSGFPLITPSVCTPSHRNEQSRMITEKSFSTLVQGTVPPCKGNHHKTPNPVLDVSLMKSPAVLKSACKTLQRIQATQDDGGSFLSPPVSTKVISEQILESLGAEVDPDMSWTSSLATPPSLTPTVIICKAKESEFHQDKAKEIQVPLLLHSNLNIQHDAFAFGQRTLPVIGEEENEEIEGVDQNYKPEDGPHNLANESRNYKDGKQTVPNEAVSFTECTSLELRGEKPNAVKAKNKVEVNNLKIDSVKSLPSKTSEYCTSQSIAADSDIHILSNTLAFNSGKDCNMKGVFMNSGMSVDQNVYDRSSEELSGCNISLSDWSQLNLSELNESQMINGGFHNADPSTNALCLSNTGNTAFVSNENVSHQHLENMLGKDLNKGSSCISSEDISSVARSSVSCSSACEVTENQFNYCKVAEDYRSIDKSIKNSKPEAKSSSLNCTCDRFPLSKLAGVEIPCRNCLLISDSLQMYRSAELKMGSDSENVALGSFASRKMERKQADVNDLESEICKIKPLATLKDYKASLTDSVNNGDKSNQPIASTSTSLVLDSVKVQGAGEEHSFLLSTLKGHSRKFLYSVQGSLKQHDKKNTSLGTDLQTITEVLPLASTFSCTSPAKKSENHQKPGSVTCGKNEDSAPPESVSCIDFCVEASDKCNIEANESLLDGHQLFEKNGKVQDIAPLQHLKDETVDKLSHAFNNDRSWDNFGTPSRRRHSHNNKERRIFATARRTVAKRLTMEFKTVPTNSVDVQTEGTEESCAPAVNSVQPEKTKVSESTLTQYTGRTFEPPSLTDTNQSPVHHNGGEAKCEVNSHYLSQHDSTCIAPVSIQLSTNVIACTSVVIQAVSSHSYCVSHGLHKTEQCCLNSENNKRTLKNKSELQQKKTNIETPLICSSSGKRLEESLTTKKELSNTDQRSGLHNLSGGEKRIFSNNTNIHNHNRKIAVLASTLKARKLKPDIVNDAFLVFSNVLPEYEIEYKENDYTTAERTPCNLPSSMSSGHEMTGTKSKLTENLHTETRADLSASETTTELFDLSEVTEPLHNIEPYKGENTVKIELESENPGVELSSVMIKETCTVLENTKNLISEDSEPYKCGPCGADFNLLTQNHSQEKLLQKFENDNSEANSAQAQEFVTSKNIFENQKGNCPVLTEAEIKTKSSEPQNSTEIVKQPSVCFAKTHTFDTSETLFEKKLLSEYKSLTASQAEDVNKLFCILEDTNSQFEFTQFGKQPAASEVNKDNDLLNKQLYCTLPSPVSDKWQDVNFDAQFDIESSMILNSKPCNLQQLAEFSKMETNSAIYLQNTVEVDQTTPNEHVTSFGSSNKNKGVAAFTVPHLCTDSTVLASNTVKMHTDTMLKIIPPQKDAVSFCTASGSKIKFSDESLQRAKNIFKDIGNDIDQISDHAHTINALSYSVIGSKTISEPKLSDAEISKSSESYLLHPARFNLNSNTNLDNVLQNERTIVNNRKDENSAVNIVEEGKAMYLSTEQDLQWSDGVDVVQLGTMKIQAYKNNLYNFDCSSTKVDGKVEFGSRMEVSDDDLLSSTFASLTKSSDEAINAKGSNDTMCFHIASGKEKNISKKDLNVAAGLLETKDSYTENLQDTGTAKSTSQQLDMQMNNSAAFVVPNGKNSEDCIALRNKEAITINSSFDAIETGMKGFQTANGKMVTVSKASLDKATALFAEKDLSNETKHNISSESLEPNLSNPLIQKAIKNGKMKHLKNNHSHVNSKNNSRMHDSSMQSHREFEEFNTGIEMKSFQMASGKQISVSKMALNKGRALFFDDDYNEFNVQPSLISPEPFKNAPSEDYTLNDNALEANPTCRLETINQDSSLPSKQYLAHCAANGSSIYVSEANLKYAEEKFTEDKPGERNVSVLNPTFDNNQGNYANGITMTELPKHFFNTGPIAFSTASGKPVQVSEESLKKCKQMFSDVVSEEETEIISGKDVKSKEKGHPEKKWQSDSSITKASLGFNTASGKPVLVSDDALQKVKCMLKEFESSPMCTKTKPFEKAQQLQLSPTSLLFSDTTMGGEQSEEGSELIHRKLDNSTENISNVQNPVLVESSKRKMNELAINRPKRNSSASCTNTCILMSGFQTATGKEVMVEESNLTMARVQLASNKTDKLDHTAEKSNILTEARSKSICNVNHASTPIAHALKNNYITNPEIPKEKMEKWTMKDSKATIDHDGFDYKPSKAFRCSHAFIDETIGPDLRTGKRPSSEVRFATEEPLSKRRLLSEFDSTLPSDHKSTFKPLKCNPEGAFCDRRKFMYNIPLKPVISAPSKDKSLSNSSHQQMISPNVTIPVHENSVRQDLYLHHDIKQSKRQVAVFKPPFHSDSGGHRQLKKSRQSTPKSGKTFLPPFKTDPNYNQMEKQLNMEAVISPVPNESECSTKANNRSGPIKDGRPLKGDTIATSEDKIQSISGTSEECKASDEEFSRIVQTWHFARNLQERRLMKKKKQTIHPQPGSLYRSKNCTSKLSLHTAVEGKAPTYFTEEKLYSYGVSRSTLCVQAGNAESFKINIQEFFSEELLNASNGLPLADGGCLIPDDNGMAGKSEFYRALLDTPGVDSSLIGEVWAYNHYRWLVWKLAAMEVAFPKQFSGRCLTPERILLQLKYRYDVEIDQSRRSALKRIMERDDIAAKTLVLCISKIISLGSRSIQNKESSSDAFKEPKTPIEKGDMKTKSDMSFGVIEVTDGWYGIKALLDSPLTALLRKRRLVVGQKIIVHGAELVGSQDPCSPLEAPESLMMKISANSTRPARWHTKLGYHCDPRPFPLPLSSLFGEGGMVGCVDIIVVRTYPIQWMEKSASGMYVFRNERAEEREAHTHYENQQRKLEKVYDKIEAELLAQRRVDKKEKREHKMQRLSEQQIMMLQDGRELYEALQNSSDPLSIEACLSEQQFNVLNNYRQLLKEQEKMQIEAEFKKALENAQGDNSCIKRNVSPLWKLCVMDYKCQDSSAVYMLSIWRPIAELHSLLKEGGRYRICYLSATTCKGRHSHVDLQLTATKKTRYQQLQPSPKVLQRLYQPRKAVTYGMLCDPSFRAICKEVDLAGYVVYILEKAVGPSTIYLADEDQDLVAIKIWASFKQLAVEDIIKLGALVVASNLKWTTENFAGIPVLLTGELSNFSANPKDRHLREKYIQLKSSVQNIQSFIKDTEKKVKTILGRSDAPKSNRESGDVHTPNQKSFLVPLISSNVKRKLQPLTTENGSKSMLCSTKITPTDSVTELKKRVNLLSRIPSPVPLPQLSNCVSPSVQKDFRPPSCATPQSADVVRTSSNNLAQVLSLKKTDVVKTADNNWVTDEELAMIDTRALLEGGGDGHSENDKEKVTGAQISSKDCTLLPQNVKNYLGTQISKMVEDNWVTDEELAMINTQALYEECAHGYRVKDSRKVEKSQVVQMTEFT